MLLSEVDDLSNKANQFIADTNRDPVDRKLVEQSLKNLAGELNTERNENYFFVQEPEMQEQLDNNLSPDPDVHPFVKTAAEELQVLMNQYLN